MPRAFTDIVAHYLAGGIAQEKYQLMEGGHDAHRLKVATRDDDEEVEHIIRTKDENGGGTIRKEAVAEDVRQTISMTAVWSVIEELAAAIAEHKEIQVEALAPFWARLGT
ncbi:hypothetical protein GMLC_25510 [Geomonas limicola]|uniref:Uncharacterized protein n=2 Tax=Geomonas limicola TaxID=2740186 RepID=A0A6V8N8R4_9BACT|nr:hypothetical protein GMLC_25510 [Geomonas limicola]